MALKLQFILGQSKVETLVISLPKTKMTMETTKHEWRCILDWKKYVIFQLIAILVFGEDNLGAIQNKKILLMEEILYTTWVEPS